MKKGTPIQLTIERYAYPMKGLAKLEDGVFQADGFFPGETIQGEFSGWKQKRGRLRNPQVLEYRPDYVAPACRHYGLCGGCISQHLPLDSQRQLKLQAVQAMFDQAELELVTPLEILGQPDKYRYRNKMEFNFGDAIKDGSLTLGMHQRGHGFNILDTEDCQLITDDMNSIRTYTVEYFREAGIPFYQWLRREGILRHLIIRHSHFGGELMVVLVTTSQFDHDLTPWLDGLQALKLNDQLTSVYHVENDTIGNVVQADQMHLLYGNPTITEHILGLQFEISPLSFFQTNSAGTELLYQRVLDLTDHPRLALDLYCGTGTISQLLARTADHVIGVELIEESVAAAKLSAQKNKLDNVEFIAGDVKDVIGSLTEPVDLIVVDPPRAGLHPKVIDNLLKIAPEKLLYVSCNPKSLVQDLLKLEGYQLDHAELIDMFPDTPHVEALVLMTREGE